MGNGEKKLIKKSEEGGRERERERGISGLMPTPGHSGVARLSAAMSHEQTLASGRDYYAAAAAPRWSDTLNFLAHGEKGRSGIKAGEARKEIFFFFPPASFFFFTS